MILKGLQWPDYQIINHRNMSIYEMMVILSPELGEAQTNEELAEIRHSITAATGKIHHEDIHGAREFAYRIGKFDSGFYAVFHFAADPLKVKEMEKTLNIHQPVLRYLIVKTPKNYIFKTLAEYDAEAELEEKRKMKEKEERRKKIKGDVTKVGHPGGIARYPAKALADGGKPAEVEKIQSETKPESREASSKDLEKKLDSLIDDPDITL